MIDFDDVEFGLLASMGATGWVAVILGMIGIVILCVAVSNHKECQKKTCPIGSKPILANNRCLCVVEAK